MLRQSLTRTHTLSMVLVVMVVALWSVHHARRKFFWAELSPVLANAAALGFLVWALPRYGLTGLAVAASVFFMLNLALQLIALEKSWLSQREWSAAT